MSAPGTDAVVRTILVRRSVRTGFAGAPVPTDTLDAILRCGLAAPSSKNAQPWRLHVVPAGCLLETIAAATEVADEGERYVPHDPVTGEPWPQWTSTVTESAQVLRECAVGIFIENLGIFSRGRDTLAAVPTANLVGSLVGYTFEIVGIGAAIQNMWVAATALGVVGTFMGDVAIAEASIRDLLGIDRDLVGVLALGLRDEAAGSRPHVRDVTDSGRVVWHEVDL